MTKPILIVGGGPAGLAAAHALARVGQPSVLVEKEDRLGGAPILSGYAKLVPSGEWAKDAIGGMVDRVIKDPLVEVHTGARVDAIEREVDAHLEPIGHRVYAIVNYDHFELAPEVEEAYAAMVKGLVDRYYDGVSRYTTSGFLRAKLGSALRRRGVAPHVYESPQQALAHVRDA